MRRFVWVVCIFAGAGLASAQRLGLAPDGGRVAVTWPLEGRSRLAIGGARGREFRFVSDAFVVGGLGWSPNAQWVTAQTDHGLRLFDVERGRFRGTFGAGATGPAIWRPDSAQVAYFDGRDLVAYSIADQREATRARVPFRSPIQALWIPRNDGIAVLADGDVWLVEQGQTTRVSQTGDVVGVGLSPRGDTLYWMRQGKNMGYILGSLFAYNLQQRSVMRLPFPDRINGLNPLPRLGPQRLRVAFGPGADRMVLVAEFEGRSVAVLVRRDGGGARSLGAIGPGSFEVAWSADGACLGLLAVTPTTRRLTTFDRDGSDGREVASWGG